MLHDDPAIRAESDGSPSRWLNAASPSACKVEVLQGSAERFMVAAMAEDSSHDRGASIVWPSLDECVV
jgi:hypothetical protein